MIGDRGSRIQDRGSVKATGGGLAIGDRRWAIVGILLCLLTGLKTAFGPQQVPYIEEKPAPGTGKR